MFLFILIWMYLKIGGFCSLNLNLNFTGAFQDWEPLDTLLAQLHFNHLKGLQEDWLIWQIRCDGKLYVCLFFVFLFFFFFFEALKYLINCCSLGKNWSKVPSRFFCLDVHSERFFIWIISLKEYDSCELMLYMCQCWLNISYFIVPLPLIRMVFCFLFIWNQLSYRMTYCVTYYQFSQIFQ